MNSNSLNSNSRKMASLGRINYMNIAPVYYGLDNGLKPDWLEMVSYPPAVLNRMMSKGSLDIGPVSSAAYARHQDEWLILPDLSIGCFGKVMSVLLVSKYPLEHLDRKKIVMTNESATSTELLRLICAAKNVRPAFECGTVKTASDLPDNTAAALVIGDAALTGQWGSRFDHIIDLGEMWRDLTGLPFVFALWVVRKSFAENNPSAVAAVVELFNLSKHAGRMNIERIAAGASEKLGLEIKRCRKYYDRLNYDLGPHQIKGLEVFFDGLWRENLVPRKICLNFFKGPSTVKASVNAA